MAERLFWAAYNGRMEEVRQLLDQGVPLDEFRDQVKCRAACYGAACADDALHVVGCATGEQDGYTALMAAALRGRTDIVRLLLDRGASIQHANDVSTSTCLERGGGVNGCTRAHVLLPIYRSIHLSTYSTDSSSINLSIHPTIYRKYLTSGLGLFCYALLRFSFIHFAHS